MQEHITAWIDEEIPVLLGKTSRQAVRAKKGRAQVLAMLKDQEHSAQRSPGFDRVDFSAVYAELGLACGRHEKDLPPTSFYAGHDRF